MWPATSLTAWKSTSPTRPASVRLMPTSITVAPGLTMSAVTNFALPMATMRMSAVRQISGRFLVRLWQTVTVASPPGPRCMSMMAMGLPTISLRPSTTTLAPAMGMLLRMSSCWMPWGVQGRNLGGLARSGPTFCGMEGVDVLQGIDGFEHLVFVYLLGQGELDQDAVHRRIAIEPVDQGEQFAGGGFGF